MFKAHVGAHQLGQVTNWQKSTKSGAAGHCVEVAEHDGRVLVRNSNDPDSGALGFTPAEMSAFVAGVKAGEFNHLVIA